MVTLDFDDAVFNRAASAAPLLEFFAQCRQFNGAERYTGDQRHTFALAAFGIQPHAYRAVSSRRLGLTAHARGNGFAAA